MEDDDTMKRIYREADFAAIGCNGLTWVKFRLKLLIPT